MKYSINIFISICIMVSIYSCSSSTPREMIRTADSFYESYKYDMKESKNTLADEAYRQSSYDLALAYLKLSMYRYLDVLEVLISNPKIIRDSLLYDSDYCWACEAFGRIFGKGEGKYDAAILCHEKRVELFPDNSISYGWLVNLYNRTSNYDKAIKYAERLLSIMPAKDNSYDSLFVFDWLVYLYDKTNKYNKVVEFGDKLLELENVSSVEEVTHRDNLYIVAYANEREGNKEKAIEYYKDAAKLGHKHSKEWLDQHNIEY